MRLRVLVTYPDLYVLSLTDSHQMHNIPQLNDLPEILEKSNRLARIDRYLSGLEEFQSFFSSVRQLFSAEAAPETGDNQIGFRSTDVTKSADFEAARAQEKIQQEQRLCQTYMRQYDTLVQLVSLHPDSLHPYKT